MNTGTRISIGALNISASPHPAGTYEKLLQEAADNEVPVWGSDWASITPPQRLSAPRQNFLEGRILLWTIIRKDRPWLNKKKRAQATREESQKASGAIPPDFEPNYRSFHYLFIEDKHRLLFETQNELGERFGAKRAEKFFQRLLSPDYLSKESPLVDVTIIPEEESLERILGMPGLRRLEILIKRPNSDYSEAEYHVVMDDLVEQGAKSRKTELVRAPKTKALIPNLKTRTLAAIGSTDGYVKGEGSDANGRPIFESTRDHPKIRHRHLDASSVEVLLSSVPLFL